MTTAGRLPFKAIIHVAGISLLWRSSERSIRDSVRDAMAILQRRAFQSVAIPWIGAGSGGGNPLRIQTMIEDELTRCPFDGEVRVVRYSNVLANLRVNSRAGSDGF